VEVLVTEITLFSVTEVTHIQYLYKGKIIDSWQLALFRNLQTST